MKHPPFMTQKPKTVKDLSWRAQNTILWFGLVWDRENQTHIDLKWTDDEIRCKLQSGEINLKKMRNRGNGTAKEIYDFYGLDSSRFEKRKWKFDPITGKPL